MNNRVVITSVGMISPIGHTADTTWNNLLKGNSGVSQITSFDTTDFETTIAAEVKNFDPKVALFGGGDGLKCYKAIFNDVIHFLNPGGRFITEVGYAQSAIVKKLFFNSGFTEIKVTKDLNNINRVVSGRLLL